MWRRLTGMRCSPSLTAAGSLKQGYYRTHNGRDMAVLKGEAGVPRRGSGAFRLSGPHLCECGEEDPGDGKRVHRGWKARDIFPCRMRPEIRRGWNPSLRRRQRTPRMGMRGAHPESSSFQRREIPCSPSQISPWSARGMCSCRCRR